MLIVQYIVLYFIQTYRHKFIDNKNSTYNSEYFLQDDLKDNMFVIE